MISTFLLRNFVDNISYASLTKKQIVIIILGKILLTRKTYIQWPQVQIKHSNNYRTYVHITCCIFKTISLVYFNVSANLLHSSKDYFCRQIIRSLESHSEEDIRNTPFYSAPSISVVFRNLVQEIWFEKYGLRKVVDQKKGGFIP